MGRRVYTYGIVGELPEVAFNAFRFRDGGQELTVVLRPPLKVTPGPLIHEQVLLQPVDLEWWNDAIGRIQREGLPGPQAKRRAKFHRLDLWLDSGRCLCLPVILHRPLVPDAVVYQVRIRFESRGRRRPLSLVSFLLEAPDHVWARRS